MPNFQFNVTVPAGGSIANALAGSPFEFVGRNSKVAIALAMNSVDATPAATTVGMITTNITFGAELQLQNGSPPLERTAGAGALIPDNVSVDDVAAAGDRLVIELLSNHTAAIDVRGIVRILPF
jgi:hypothetical protein